jgi:hypothetical protein
MQSKASSVQEYLEGLPADRRAALSALRKVITKNLDKDFEEGMQYGMIGYYVPHRVYPAGYHCDPKQPLPFASLASQKNHIGIYLFCIYTDAKQQARFVEAWKKSGKKLDMGKSCVRVKRLEDVPLEVLGTTIKGIKAKDFIASYEAQLGPNRRPVSTGRPARKTAKKATKKTTKKVTKNATKKTAKKAAKKSAKRAAKRTSAR